MASVFMLGTRKILGGIYKPEVIDILPTDRDIVYGMHFHGQSIVAYTAYLWT